MVNEKKETKEAETEDTTKDSDEGDKPKSRGLIDDANSAAERLEAANKKQEELITRQEEIAAKQLLAGKTEAGQAPVKEEPISDKEFSDKVMSGEVNPLGV